MLYRLASYDGPTEVFNLSSNVGTSQNDVLDIIKDLLPDVNIKYSAGRSVDAGKIILSNERIMKLIDFNLVEISTGIRNYYSYILQKQI